jgi:hypothetical protein
MNDYDDTENDQESALSAPFSWTLLGITIIMDKLIAIHSSTVGEGTSLHSYMKSHGALFAEWMWRATKLIRDEK